MSPDRTKDINMIKTGDNQNPINLEKIIKGITILGVILFTGTIGYMIIEGWTFSDSLYMTIITITTVGFGEVRAISAEGRLFTIFIIFSAWG